MASTKRLYSYKTFFRLIIDGNLFLIDEPIGWDDVRGKLPRDDDYFSFVADFISASKEFGFGRDDTAYQLIKNIYNRDGQDGKILFQFVYNKDGVTHIPFQGNLNLNTYSDKDGEIRCSIEKSSFESLFRTRFDTPITLNSVLSLDNKAMPAAPIKNVSLHSKLLVKTFKAQTATPLSAKDSIARFLYLQMDTANEVTSELGGNQSLPFGISGQDPVGSDRYFFKVEEEGNFRLQFSASFNMRIARPVPIQKVGKWELTPRFIIRRNGVVIEETWFNAFRMSGDTSSSSVTFLMSFSFFMDKELEIGDELFWECTGTQEYKGVNYVYEATNYQSSVEITAKTIAESTSATCYRIFDVLNYMIESATGQRNALVSSFFSAGGAGYNYVLLNGYQVRNFQTSTKPFVSSLKDLFSGIFAIFGLGYGIKKVGSREIIYIEEASHFYNKNEEIFRFLEIFDFSEDHAKNFVYNELEIGYEKFAEEEPNTMDEFNTFHNLLTPIQSYKSKFVKKSKIISSGYLLERQRREQFNANPSESLTNDDDIFILSVVENAGSLSSEKNLSFSTVTGIFSPESAYNLRLTPGRMKYNWSPIINIGLYKKKDSESIQNTFIKNNDALSSALNPSDPYRRNDPAGVLNERENVLLSEFRSGARAAIHQPIFVTFKAVLDYDDFIYIKERLVGESSTINDHGYIVHPDLEAKLWKAFVYDIEYNFADRIAELKVAKIDLL